MRPSVGGSRALRATAAALVWIAGCTTTRPIEQRDWGALRGSERITVVTLDGTTRELRAFRFLTTGLVGRGEWADVAIPLDSIAMVEVREPSTAGTVLVVLAAATAVGVLIAQTESPEKPEPDPSCPFVYSFDGERYRFDSETFAGAIAPGLDRTDYDNLEYLRAVDGVYRLRLTNERPETQYTDELRLQVVDHPLGTLAVPDRQGRVLVLSDPQAPRSARDSWGSDVADAVRSADGTSWRGAPVESADLDDPAALREALVLSFRRPPGARQARIVVRARNTGLAPFALREFLRLQGDDLFSWYLQVGRDEALRERIRGWVAREGMLHVSVLRDGRWSLAGVMPDVGPAIDKSQALAFDLDGEDGDSVVVKLESARGLWEIDWVAIDAGPEPPSRVTEVGPRRAHDERGRDIAALLETADERYYGTVEGAVAELEFDEPPRRPGSWARSVVLKSRGFYHIYVPHEGPSRAALAERILDEPLLGNRHVLEAWLQR